MKALLENIKSKCKTKRQMKAFNQLVTSFAEDKPKITSLKSAYFPTLDKDSDFYNSKFEQYLKSTFRVDDTKELFCIDSYDLSKLPRFSSVKETKLEDGDGNPIYICKSGGDSIVVLVGGGDNSFISTKEALESMKFVYDPDSESDSDRYYEQFE